MSWFSYKYSKKRILIVSRLEKSVFNFILAFSNLEIVILKP